ncbi:NAD(P)/FAD-dependent oxidoreductase [Methylobacterium nodulans]|uniref:FAD dependent oxidoreductase n=1 Tax=Methylobacterium nodulans (strain LMG 21967 / CNCM I-2342 / ORS 2060) TaxID=460265 RepID=B8IA74_METNO|nr:FAD-binding oxidoreductase [Methylobacterium nodulans]ACL59137.1 FAD dependent oxidoreductase [Methylobacterium nodulans ORS 2060]
MVSTANGRASRHGRSALVIGAGAVGLSAAVQLGRRGLQVTVLDEAQPGGGASHGNSGMLVADTAMPTSLPGMIRKVPRWLSDPLGPLTIRAAYLPKAMPWLWRYLKAGTRRQVFYASAALRELNRRTFSGWADLIGPAEMARLVRQDGQIYLWEGLKTAPPPGIEDEIRAMFGIQSEIIGPDQIRQFYPGIARTATHGLLIRGNGHTVDPGGLTRALAERFVAEGGELAHERVLKLWPRDGGGWSAMTNLTNHTADLVVVAAGAWSTRLLAPLGIAIPLETERGYHVMLPTPSIRLGMPILSKTGYFGMCSMAGGLRVSGTVEIAGLDAPPTLQRAENLLVQAKRLFPSLEHGEPIYWMGHRPSTPDSLPVIGPIGDRPGLYGCFGHGHAGMTGAPASGQLLAQLIADERPSFDPAPYSAARF